MVQPAPTIAPTRTPVTPFTPERDPDHTPWPERYTDPDRICPQQRREMPSPDVAP